MKNLYILFLINTLVAITDTRACNVCGCGVGNYHYGILPQFQKNFIGVRYQYYSYDSHLEKGHHDGGRSHETFQRAELWGRFYPARRVQAFVFIPYHLNERVEGEETLTLRGPGDIVVSASYNLFNTYDSLKPAIKQNLLIGAGIKLPTGEYQAIENGQTVNQNFQPGTGSVDYLFNLIYTVRYKKAGMNTELTYNLNTTNKDEYRFGNTFKTGLTAFYLLPVGAFTMMPNAGISLETNRDNRQFGIPFEDTGGWVSLYRAGLETYYRNFAVGLSYTHPGRQELFNGHVKANDRFAAHVTVMF